jgi:hypothetical protein
MAESEQNNLITSFSGGIPRFTTLPHNVFVIWAATTMLL